MLFLPRKVFLSLLLPDYRSPEAIPALFTAQSQPYVWCRLLWSWNLSKRMRAREPAKLSQPLLDPQEITCTRIYSLCLPGWCRKPGPSPSRWWWARCPTDHWDTRPGRLCQLNREERAGSLVAQQQALARGSCTCALHTPHSQPLPQWILETCSRPWPQELKPFMRNLSSTSAGNGSHTAAEWDIIYNSSFSQTGPPPRLMNRLLPLLSLSL